ncbi:MAG TPA: DinB family protein [Thermomicrobiales bacterium]|nr:DinB family protein [Thermomicrobiales bacterium]
METSHGWFDVRRFPHGVTMIAEPGHYEDVKSYLIEGDRDVAVLDTGMGVGDFADLVASLTDRDPIVLHSHAHFDHIGASHRYDRVLVHPTESADLRAGYPNSSFEPWFSANYLVGNLLPDEFDPATSSIPGCEPTGELNHGDRIDLGERELEVFYTPGHSPGGVTLLDRAHRALFPGDAVYAGPMFAYRPYSDPVRYRETLELLAKLADHVDTVYPSHNAVPLTADDVRDMHRAYEEIWAGRTPDREDSEKHVFEFGNFSFWLRPGAYGPAAPISPTIAELKSRIVDARRALLNYVATLDEARRTELRDSAGWSVKDHLAHLIRWERSIIYLLTGRPRHEGLGVERAAYEAEYGADGNIDELNAMMHAQDRDLPFDEVIAALDATHVETFAALAQLSDSDIMREYSSFLPDEPGEETGRPIVFWIAGNTAFHYAEHLEWMQELAGFDRS